MKAYREVDVKLHSFLTSKTEGYKMLATTQKLDTLHSTPVGPRVCPNVLEKIKYLALSGFETRFTHFVA